MNGGASHGPPSSPKQAHDGPLARVNARISLARSFEGLLEWSGEPGVALVGGCWGASLPRPLPGNGEEGPSVRLVGTRRWACEVGVREG